MTHLSEALLNAFLDNELAPDARSAAAVHLAECARCRLKLGALQGIFGALAGVRSEPIPLDLTPRVMAQTHARGSWSRIIALLAAQAALAALLAAWLAPSFGEWAAVVKSLVLPGALPALELPVGLDAAWPDAAAAWSSVSSDLAQIVSAFAMAPIVWTVAVGVAAVIWLAGNRWLLGGRIRE